MTLFQITEDGKHSPVFQVIRVSFFPELQTLQQPDQSLVHMPSDSRWQATLHRLHSQGEQNYKKGSTGVYRFAD